MTDADGSIVQPDYVISCWCVTNGMSLGWGWGVAVVVWGGAGGSGVNLE